MRTLLIDHKYTKILIAINVIIFLAVLLLQRFVDLTTLYYALALIPAKIVESFSIWTLLTSVFVHTLFLHLFLNMISLFFVGRFVEPLIGSKRFLQLFIGAGLFASIVHTLVSFIQGGVGLHIPAIGASGAVMGLIGILAVLTPKQKVLLFFVIPIPMWALGILLILAVVFDPSIGGLLIGHVAHLAGFAFGAGYGAYLTKKFPDRTKRIRKVFS